MKNSGRYSPLQKLLEAGRGVRQSLLNLPENAHGAYLELERDIGYFDVVDPPFKIDGNYTIDIGIKMF